MLRLSFAQQVRQMCPLSIGNTEYLYEKENYTSLLFYSKINVCKPVYIILKIETCGLKSKYFVKHLKIGV